MKEDFFDLSVTNVTQEITPTILLDSTDFKAARKKFLSSENAFFILISQCEPPTNINDAEWHRNMGGTLFKVFNQRNVSSYNSKKRLVGASEIDALDRDKWKKQISRQTP